MLIHQIDQSITAFDHGIRYSMPGETSPDRRRSAQRCVQFQLRLAHRSTNLPSLSDIGFFGIHDKLKINTPTTQLPRFCPGVVLMLPNCIRRKTHLYFRRLQIMVALLRNNL